MDQQLPSRLPGSHKRTSSAALIAVGVALAIVGSHGSVRAAVIHDNGGPFIGLAAAASFADANNASFTEVADDFTLAAGLNTIRDIHWWGIYNTGIANPPADGFTITIYDDSSGAPGAVNSAVNISSLVRTATADIVTDRTVYKYDAVVSDMTLTAGSTYWLGISNNSGGNAWAWVQSNPFSGNLHQYSVANGSFSLRQDEAAFNLTNDIVPEPSGIVLAGIAFLAAMWGWKRRA
jgi:hypothetical protein